MIQRPVAMGLFLCEKVIIEEGTRNITPVNCFTHRSVKRFPSEQFPFEVFSILTDGLGEMALQVLIRGLDTMDEVYQRSTTFRFPDPLQEVRFGLRIRDCSFPHAGYYEVILFAGNELVA